MNTKQLNAFMPEGSSIADPVGLIATLQKQVRQLREALQEIIKAEDAYGPAIGGTLVKTAKVALAATEEKKP